MASSSNASATGSSPLRNSRAGRRRPPAANEKCERLDLSRVDEEFCRLFRCQPGVKSERQLDRLSLLACERQGILPKDLLPVEPKPGADASLVQAAAKRRTAKISIVEQQRRHLHQIVVGAATAQHLTHEQHQLQADLNDQESTVGRHHGDGIEERAAEDDAPLRCVDEEEDEDVAILLEHVPDLGNERERLQRTLEATRAKGEQEVAKLRNRQLRQVAHDIETEGKRRAMLEHIAEREAAFHNQQEEKHRALAEQARKEARDARRKMKALRIRNDALARHRAEELDARAAHHDELWRDLVAKREAQLEERRIATAKKDAIAKERTLRVKESVERKCDLLEHEAVDKVVTHEERRAMINTQLAVAREQRRVVALRKFMAARQYVESKDDGSGATRQELDSRHDEADERHAKAKAAERKRLEDERRKRDEIAAQAAKRREEMDERRARKNILTLRREVEKERDVEAARRRKEAQIERLRTLEEAKKEQHEDNIARVARQREHAQRQKDALLAEAAERDRAQRELKLEMSRKLQLARQRIAEDRERVQEQMSKVRNSRDLLEKSPEEVLEASLRRERPATSSKLKKYQSTSSTQPSPSKPPGTPSAASSRSGAHQSASQQQGRHSRRHSATPSATSVASNGHGATPATSKESAAHRASTPSSAVEAAATHSRRSSEAKSQPADSSA
jgi:hypothetical protein